LNISFLGGAGEVTGSKYLVTGNTQAGPYRYCVDFGMFQGGQEALERNLADALDNPSSLDFVLLTHAHIDHSGLLPRLCSQGFKGPIYCTPATQALLEILLYDSAHIQFADLERALKKKKQGRWRGDLPQTLYTASDVERCLAQVRTVGYDVAFSPLPGLSVVFRNAGHILGAASIAITGDTDLARGKTIVFSGDLGCFEQPLMVEPSPIDRADVLVVESTYGDRLHRTLKDTELELIDVIKTTFKRRGNIIIPAFAAGRTQEVLFLLADLVRRGELGHLSIWVDSPMAATITRLTHGFSDELNAKAQDCMSWLKAHPRALDIRLVADVEESKRLNQIKSGAIIISASGMCDAGRIQHHLLNHLDNPRNAIVFTGFQAAGTLGRRLVDGARQVRILGHDIVVKASIHTVGGLSAHADQADLIRWLATLQVPPTRTFITHGESTASTSLRKQIEQDLGWVGVEIPLQGQVETPLLPHKKQKDKPSVLNTLTIGESEERYRRLFETAQDGILMLSHPDGRIIDANPYFTRLINRTREELLGRQLWELGLIADQEASRQMQHELHGKGFARYEHLDLLAKDGTAVPVEFVSNVYKVGAHQLAQCNIRHIGVRRAAERAAAVEKEKRQALLINVVETLGAVVAGRDPYTVSHQKRVAELASAIATDMGLSADKVKAIRIAALVHDIGKVAVPIEILNKPGTLNRLEIGLLQTHAQAGHDILKTIDFPWPIADIVLQHHERLDGTGYPNGLKGSEIMVEARILAVADMVEAMSSQRPYRAPKTLKETLAELASTSGVLFDKAAVESCLRLFQDREFVFPPSILNHEDIPARTASPLTPHEATP